MNGQWLMIELTPVCQQFLQLSGGHEQILGR
jgi:hypothetical protein